MLQLFRPFSKYIYIWTWYQKRFDRVYKCMSQEKLLQEIVNDIPNGNYIFKANNRNTRTRCKICSKLTVMAPERRQLTPIFNFEHISHFLSSVYIANFQQVNAGWDRSDPHHSFKLVCIIVSCVEIPVLRCICTYTLVIIFSVQCTQRAAG